MILGENSVHCQNCGNVLFTIGEDFQMIIPSLTYKCLKCDITGSFDTIYIVKEPQRKKEGE